MNGRCEKHGVTLCMLCRMKNPTIAPTPSAELDTQAQEAAARLADTSPVEVDFGDVEAAWNTPEGHANTEVTVQHHLHPVLRPDSNHPPKISNPIVDAAAAYTSAQERVTQYMSDVDVAKEELAGAQARLTEAISDRDMKKQVLQALVGGAS
jgi:hypothetical protein